MKRERSVVLNRVMCLISGTEQFFVYIPLELAEKEGFVSFGVRLWLQ